jgi:molybdopterin synthase catalytic subunit
MRIKVLFFGLLKDVCGRAEDALVVPEGSTAGTVFDHYSAAFPHLKDLASSIVLARNHEFASPAEPLSDGDEVALLPPVSGGSNALASAREVRDPEGHLFALTDRPIDARAIESELVQGSDGAVVTFAGVVRNNTRGRATLRLEYECYEEMALRTMISLGRNLAAEFPISRIALVHRLGIMEIGEASVVIVATSPHRRAAFEAALAGIDRLKKTVPIWKKEFFADGEVWVEGDWDDSAPRVAPL